MQNTSTVRRSAHAFKLSLVAAAISMGSTTTLPCETDCSVTVGVESAPLVEQGVGVEALGVVRQD